MKEYLLFLEEQAQRYLGVLEDLFGPRDARYEFLGVGRNSDDRDFPQTYFPNGYSETGCGVEIRIEPQWYDMQHRGMSGYQIAHECVHLLDPSAFGKGPMLEEGLAVWFQDEPAYHEHHKSIRARSASYGSQDLGDAYATARNLVRRCMPALAPVIKGLRRGGTRLRDISADQLARCLPDIARDTLEALCASYPYESKLRGTTPPRITRG